MIGVFRYDLSSFFVYGFKKIKKIGEDEFVFDYKNKSLIVKGKHLVATNLFDHTLTIRGLIEEVRISYLGDNYD